MNQMFKKASSVFTAIVCAASITFSGASLVLADGEIDEQTKTTIETTAEGLTNTIIPLTEDEIAAYMESGDAFTENAMTAWDSAREELGDLKKAGSAEIEYSNDEYTATVPKVNVVIGKAYGTAYVAMNSKSVGADLVYAWDSAEIGMMDASLAAKIMYPGADAASLNEKAAEYRNLQSGVESAAARGYVDTVIAPADTRKYVIGAFEMLFTKREDRPAKKHSAV